MSRVFITGGTGKLKRELVKFFSNSLHPTYNALDITNENTVLNFIKDKCSSIAMHVVTTTNIMWCEAEKELTWKVNFGSTKNLVRVCLKYQPNCYFAYISTALAFHEDKERYYLIHRYGQYKSSKVLEGFINENVRRLDPMRVVHLLRKVDWLYRSEA